MCAGDEAKANRIADRLCDVKEYLSHGAVIAAEEARDMGLNVEVLEPESDL
jgi:ribosomal protein L18